MPSADPLRYPVGKFESPAEFQPDHIRGHVAVIDSFPGKLRMETAHLNDAQLDTPYREGGWTVRQVVHHVADSHINSYCRFRLALTEENPVIRPYFEERWAELTDARTAPVSYSLNLVEAVHARWVLLLNSMKEADYRRTFYHPEQKKEFALYAILSMYAWHCDHHLAHITNLKKRMNW